MSLPRSAAEILDKPVILETESIDRQEFGSTTSVRCVRPETSLPRPRGLRREIALCKPGSNSETCFRRPETSTLRFRQLFFSSGS